jgi:hypothetical protein
MKFAALVVALVVLAVGVVGLVSPDTITALRRLYFATPDRLHAASAVRVAMGLVLILSASVSCAPRTLRVLGAVMCLQGVTATLLGIDRAQAVLEWEATQGALQRIGAGISLGAAVFIAWAVRARAAL